MSEGEFTRLLGALRRGDDDAIHRLYALVYNDLLWVARNRLDGQVAGESMCTGDLVHEAYMKTARAVEMKVRDRGHFFRLAARAMRQILTDRARKRSTAKRGGEPVHLDLDPGALLAPVRGEDLVALDGALSELEEVDPRCTQVVELRFFAGLSLEETAETLELSESTVKRDWEKARMFLLQRMAR
jgi:RNA polymerase sigma factor (TIGR02999 family)